MAVQAVNVPLGLGKLYFKRASDADGKYRMVGALKGDVTFTYKQELVEQKAGEMMGKVRRDRIDEECMLKASVCDFKVEQLIALLGLSVSTTQLTVTNSIRRVEQFITGVSTTTTQTLSQTAKSITSAHLTSLDRSTEYVKGTDYTMPTARAIRPLTAGFKNKTVLAHYSSRRATKRVRVGDNKLLQEVSLRFVHKLSSGKFVTLDIPRATVSGDIAIPFSEKDYTVYDIQFSGLADPTLAEGTRLFTIARES